MAASLKGAEHANHEGVLSEGEDVAFHEHLLDLVAQYQILLVDLLDGEALPRVPVAHQVDGPVHRSGKLAAMIPRPMPHQPTQDSPIGSIADELDGLKVAFTRLPPGWTAQATALYKG